jgi:hypothetical protein
MCRLAIFGGIRKEKPLQTALIQLERSMGGHGNGYWDTHFKETIKGLSLLPEDIAEMSYGQKGTHLFHTRLATAGGMRDELNHPFEGKEWVVMHNGHWYEWDRYAEYEMSDTQCAARIIDENGPGVLLNRAFDDSGVWIMAREEEVYVCSRSSYRNFLFQKLKSGGFFHASERIKNFAVEVSMAAEEGEFYRVFGDGTIIPVEMPMRSMPEPVNDEAWYEYWKAQNLGQWSNYNAKYDDTGFCEDKWWESESWADAECGVKKTPYNAGEEDDQLTLELPTNSVYEQSRAAERMMELTTRTNVVPMSRALPAPTEDDFDEEKLLESGEVWRRYGKLWTRVEEDE